jgi:acetyl-CoA acetyltransferase
VGWTVPSPDVFYGAPALATRVGLPGISGPMVSQACATSVSVLRSAAASIQQGTSEVVLAVAADRTSNGPLLVYPQPGAPGGAPKTEHWVLDSFARDPGTSLSMLATAEAVATEAGISRAELDDLTALRHAQYEAAGRGTGEHVVPVVIPGRRSDTVLEEDEGVRLSTKEDLSGLPPAAKDGLHSFGSQTHPADGAAGALVTTVEHARELSGIGVVELLGFGTARVEPARMPKAPVPAAMRALKAAGLEWDAVDLVTTHNPFGVNDVYFSKQTGFPLERMNTAGCSLVYGHPQSPTGLRSIVELISSLKAKGGGIGLFTGCAAGDTGAALVLRVTD